MHDDPFMERCLQLARLGAASATPNPMVGAVLARHGTIIAEGWHHAAGRPHAEVECLTAFGDGPVPTDAVLYVNLEPCAHLGRTPPCADLLIARGVRHVVVAHPDPFPQVAGRGIARLRAAGVRVDVGVREAEARWMNRRFLTSVELGRPYIVLKWARTSDGFLDRHPRAGRGVHRISSAASEVLVHRWRSEEQAILVGGRTVENDDPALTVRHVEGRQPLRVVLDRSDRTPAASKVYDGSVPTLLFTARPRSDVHIEQVITPLDADPLNTLLAELHRRNIRSVLVEGGATLLGHFLWRGLWDEARVITGAVAFGAGTAAPDLPKAPARSIRVGTDRIDLVVHGHNPEDAWCW
ncbi:MAG: bifunctional diaminohydroxyphosphoribosylaminopyrimidine deaminase/5-amino-6-(5-phosphoribosylamino)uracil reductase RibD [Flavobacteriales bacterium]|jgi:diaminohydroxyphosphoribosylaminopyrimidine deaminase/5-amino-6-(5-phosphoribosylamino)uracil reductase|nr:bifunctional diaminohydroxyphosphoribosylaminopyrimidine deaminase/5-amino-6-(5-phosphoribosylamino)uracil reductase RibD [Flavobacteriales bacterium]MBK7941571.1 bifunctional diaminohydroxyphosphoribosylaminopyrimidine deaminase/5-amino-6-(5-phosphoribosylamino)uracil reductase RibD [Flavobacteriales bacterium]MBK9700115.1 bifunctional diaminohydroxyphosphoribosylaminopyrimidine deaminase/5-amino-6-(5-phosphoribosylamino)uracil reductase RibD [Flavobacteriales bacterium]